MNGPIHAASRGRFEALDGLRGIAAFVVVLHHVELLLLPGSARLLHGYLSVDFFFALSGFVIAGAYERRILDGLTLRDYFTLRLKRFYPLIATGIVLGYLVTIWGAFPVPRPTARLVAQLLFIPAMWSAYYPLFMLNGVQWSLLVELVVNMIHAASARWLTTRRLAIVVAVSAILLFVVAYVHRTLGVGWALLNLEGGFVRGIFGFATGVLIYRLHRAGRLPRIQVPWPLLAAALPALVVVASLPWVAWRWYADPILVLVAMPALVWLGAVKPLDGVTARWAFHAGALSYPIYAIQDPVLHLASLYVVPLPTDPLRMTAVIAGVITLVVVTAWLAMRFIDQPFQRRRPRLQTTL